MTLDSDGPPQYDVICFSLEPWDQVWRRNQFFSTGLLELRPSLRLLFVELNVDVTWSLLHRRWPKMDPLRPIGDSGRLWALTPRKWLPRKLWPRVDRSLGRQVARAARKLGLRDPLFWVNDNTYAQFAASTKSPVVYDVTDDWLLGFNDARVIARERENDQTMLARADVVVVCSKALAQSRGVSRSVELITNGVDVEHFRQPTTRPADLPSGRVVLYTGTLAAGRLDLPLCVELAERLSESATLVFVGPNSLNPTETQQLMGAGAVLLGGRPYSAMPAYLQHADVIVVPHQVNPFTESLDPIKAREVLAVGRPAVSTPVAGFRELGSPVVIADSASFGDAVLAQLAQPVPSGPGPMEQRPGSWADRSRDFADALDEAARLRNPTRLGLRDPI